MYYGGERIDDVNEFMKYDIVLIIYSILVFEEFWEDFFVKKMEWLRIVLDEVYIIKNVNV